MPPRTARKGHRLSAIIKPFRDPKHEISYDQASVLIDVGSGETCRLAACRGDFRRLAETSGDFGEPELHRELIFKDNVWIHFNT